MKGAGINGLFVCIRICFFVVFCIVLPGSVYAKTTITPSLPIFSAADIATLENDFQNRADINGPGYANAFAFGNTLGYGIGRPSIGTLPHFEAGFAMNAGLTNMDYFNGNKNGRLPGIGIAPAFHAGFGLGNGIDVIGKFLSYTLELYDPFKNLPEQLRPTKFVIYNIGGRVRYNWLTAKPLIPVLLSFEGITFSIGGDMSRGLIAFGGDYEMSFSPIGPVTPYLDGAYSTDMSWYQVSGTVQATAYFNILTLFSIYTGGALSIGYGWFKFGFDASGPITDGPGGASICDLTCVSQTTYHSQNILPTYIIGLEIDIPLIKIVGETQVNLRNRKDVSASFGIRVQI
jgi:hypothetical protein